MAEKGGVGPWSHPHAGSNGTLGSGKEESKEIKEIQTTSIE